MSVGEGWMRRRVRWWEWEMARKRIGYEREERKKIRKKMKRRFLAIRIYDEDDDVYICQWQVKRYSTSTSDYEEYRAGRMVGLFITGGGPNSSYDTLFINGFRGTRRFTTLNNVDIMVENGEGNECYRCMGVAGDERGPLQSSQQIRSKSRRGSSSPSFPYAAVARTPVQWKLCSWSTSTRKLLNRVLYKHNILYYVFPTTPTHFALIIPIRHCPLLHHNSLSKSMAS